MNVDTAMEWAESYLRTHSTMREHDDASQSACVLATEVHRLRAANDRRLRQAEAKLARIETAMKAMDGSYVLPESVAKAVLEISNALRSDK